MNKPLLKQTLDALRPFTVYGRVGSRDVETAAAIECFAALKAELAKPEQTPLTKEEVDVLLVAHGKGDDGFYAFARAIENRLGLK